MVKDKLNVSILQIDTVWENPFSNYEIIEERIKMLPEETDLVVLSEMFTTGFTMNRSVAEHMDGTSVNWLKKLALSRNLAITGSIPVVENNKYYNRLIWCNKNGDILTYNKRHLFRMGEESEYYTPGKELVTIECEGWKIRPFICYDLRFPVWSRNVNNSYDILLNVANWPAPRAEVFTTLLKARAIENMCFAIGVNRVGIDGLKINYAGGSMVVDPKGKCLLGPLPGEELTESISLYYKDLSNLRTNFPAWKDADNFELLLD